MDCFSSVCGTGALTSTSAMSNVVGELAGDDNLKEKLLVANIVKALSEVVMRFNADGHELVISRRCLPKSDQIPGSHTSCHQGLFFQ